MPQLLGNIACAPCGSSLQGIDLKGACPTCGRSVGDTLHTEIIDPATMTIVGDVVCHGCGYNLRTLRIDAVCPECAGRVSDSLAPSDLCLADKAWLRRVREGLTLLLVAMGGYAVEIVLVVALAFLSAGSSAFAPGSDWILVFSVILGIIGVGGLLLITAIERNPRGRPTSNLPYLAARWALLLFFVTLIMTWVLPETGLSIGLLHVVLSGISSSSAALALILVLICLRRLAIRACQTRVRQLTTTLLWLIGVGGLLLAGTQVCLVLMMPQFQAMATTVATPPPTTPIPPYGPSTPSGTMLVAAPATPMPGWMIYFGFLSCGGGLLMVIGYLVSIVALVLYRRMLTDAIAERR